MYDNVVRAGPGGGAGGGGFGGGIYADAPAESIDWFVHFLDLVVDTFSTIFDYFFMSVSSFLDIVLGWFPAGQILSDALATALNSIVVNGVGLGELPLFLVMLGGGFAIYLMVQFVAWLTSLLR